MLYKLRIIIRTPPQIDWIKITCDDGFNFRDVYKGAHFKGAVALEKKGGTIFVVDNLKHEIRAFFLAGTGQITVGQEGNGPGDLSYPRGMTTDGSGYLFSDNSGIEAFNGSLKFIYRIRPFLSITSLSVVGKNIYCSATDSYQGHFPLVFKLNHNGKIEGFYYDDEIEAGSVQ